MFIARYFFVHEIHQGFFVDLDAFFGDHEGHGYLAGFGVRPGDDGRVRNVGVQVQVGFQFGGRNGEALYLIISFFLSIR